MSHARRLTMGLAAICVLAGGLAVASAPALAAVPAVASESVSSLTPFEAHLEATVNAGEEVTECHFQYGKASVSEHEAACEQGNALEGGEQGVSKTVTGLSAKTSYHYRVVVKNATSEAKGTGNSAEEAFTTLTLEKPVVESENTSSVNSTEATLEAQVDPDYQETTYAFEYATNKALTGAKTLDGAAALNGPGGQTASVSIGAVLQPGESYYYRIVAENETSENEGKPVVGTVHTFTTPPASFTDTPTPTSGTGARFEGHFTLIPVDTKYSFDYKVGSECTGENSTPTVDAGTGTGTATEAWEVPSAEEPAQGWPSAPPLKPNTEYTVCFVTSNAYGAQVGAPEHFTTPTAPPAIDSENASSQGPAGMTLEAKIDPNLQETTYSFEYATQEALIGTPGATKLAGESPLAAVLAELPATVKIGAPQPGKTYYYRVVAENESTTIEGKPATGEIKSYALPVLATGEAQSITQTTATLSGTVNSQGAATTYYFAYIDQAGYEHALAGDAEEKANPYAYGEATPTFKLTEPGGAPYTGNEPQTIPPTPISGLLPGHAYHYALVATSATGRETGPDETFTTPAPTPPTVSTGGVSGVSQNSATLSGTVSTNSLQTEYGFEIETEPGEHYGPATGLGSLGGAATETVTLTLGRLQPGTTYYYRVTATNADGTSQGEAETFTTPGFPTLIAPPASPPLVATPAIAFPTETGTTTTTTSTAKPLTKAQKLTKALKACKKDKKNKRTACEKQARKRFQPAKQKKHKQ